MTVNEYWLNLIEEFEEELAKYRKVKDAKYAFYDGEDITFKNYNMPAEDILDDEGSFIIPEVIR